MGRYAGPIEMDRDRLCHRLEVATRAAREAVQTRLELGRPFENCTRYRRLVLIQYAFYREIDGLYEHPGLLQLLPNLTDRRKLRAIIADLYDLGMPIPLQAMPPASKRFAGFDTASALGQLFIAEGHLLGGTHLLLQARRFGLSETLGARHLAVPALGKGLSWQALATSIDDWACGEDDTVRAIDGAHSALRTMEMVLEGFLPAVRH
jgi:heme oxygenase